MKKNIYLSKRVVIWPGWGPEPYPPSLDLPRLQFRGRPLLGAALLTALFLFLLLLFTGAFSDSFFQIRSCNRGR